MSNSVDEPFHLYLHCLQRYQFWSVGMKKVNPSPAEPGYALPLQTLKKPTDLDLSLKM